MINRLLAATALCALASLAAAQSVPVKFDSAGSTNSNLVRPGAALLKTLVVTNSTEKQAFLKIYDLVTAPVCNGSVVPVLKMMVPDDNATGVLMFTFPEGLQFFNGIGFCLTGAIADNDNTNSVTGITVNFGIKQ